MVSHTMGSGLKIASESSFFTYGVTTALARGNVILDARGAAAALHSPGTPNDGLPDQINQGALDLDGSPSFPLQGVRLSHNSVNGTGAGGMLARATTAATSLELVDNDFTAIVFHDTSAASHARWFLFNENSPSATNIGHGNSFQENDSDSGQFLSRQIGIVPEQQPH